MGSKAERASGRVKEKTGEAVGNPRLAEKGRRKQMKGDLKTAGKKVKDAAKKM